MSEPTKRNPNRVLVLTISTLGILGLLYYAGIFNPWRIYRQAKTFAGLRSHWDIDDLESNTGKVTQIRIIGCKPFDQDKQRRILDVFRHLGPYDDQNKPRGSTSKLDPANMQAVDQLMVMVDYRFKDNLFRIYSNEFSARDRDAIRSIIGDPAQYGITDNTHIFSAR